MEQLVARVRHVRGVVGIQAMQGAGKTFLARYVSAELERSGLRVCALSLDDFYRPHDELEALRAKGNHLFNVRGNPGTHDVRLLLLCLSELKAQKTTKIPRYDKSLHHGRGDRSHFEDAGPVDVVLLEGWCFGFLPVESIHGQDAMTEVNDHLRAFVPIYDLVDLWVILQVPLPEGLDWCIRWRMEAEEKMASSQGDSMTPEETRTFVVNHYFPTYQVYLQRLYDSPPAGALVLQQCENRELLS
eukprot:GEMP01067271.1.p1 GENE.GEMP01067271.1~~GEMP01067271.1.p1  ORF type:complete len:244 (+),score=54.16 GEMP01067271.1:12-743(+)